MANRSEQIAQIMAIAFDSSDEDEDEPLRLPHQIVNDEANDYIGIRLLHPVLGAIQRIEHVKIMNFIEIVVRNYNHRDFIMHFCLSRDVAYELVGRFTASKIFTSLRADAGYESVTPEKHILCFLWFLGHETSSYRDVADRFGITLSTLHKIITRVTNFLMVIAPSVIRFPTQNEKEITKEYYLREKRFPGIIGSIDGSHIRIDKPLEDKDSYINHEQFFSIQLQGVVDHNRKFIDVFIGYPGSVHDARVFRESSLFDSLDELCGEGEYLLGNSAYPCLQHLIVPYRDNGHLTKAQTSFNQRLSSCRVVVENAFCGLKQRFRQLYHFKLRDIVRIVQVVHACCVLHNLANANDLKIFEPPNDDNRPDMEAENVQVHVDDLIAQDNQPGRKLRDELCRQLATQQ